MLKWYVFIISDKSYPKLCAAAHWCAANALKVCRKFLIELLKLSHNIQHGRY